MLDYSCKTEPVEYEFSKNVGGDVRIVLVLRLGQLRTAPNRKTDVGIRGAATNLLTGDSSRGTHSDFQHADSCVVWLPRKNLLEVESENVGIIHHRPKDRMSGFRNER